jgi:hypothetical protein
MSDICHAASARNYAWRFQEVEMHSPRHRHLSTIVSLFTLSSVGCSGSDEPTTTGTEALTAVQSQSTLMQGSMRFGAHLSGDGEVPPVDTNAQGQILVDVSGDMELSYKLIVANIDDVVAAHIHCAAQGENGPVGVTLYSGDPTSQSGILAEETIMAPDAEDACGWEDIQDVVDAIVAGGAYVNVHTSANAGGEIRGQLD